MDSQKFSPTAQFKSVNSSVLSLLYGPALISIYYWKKHSFFFNIYKNVQNQEKGAERDLFKKKKI